MGGWLGFQSQDSYFRFLFSAFAEIHIRDVLDKIFSKLKAVISKLTEDQNPDARVIERVLGSCSVIAGPCRDESERQAAQITLSSLQTYLATEWKTIMSLFTNHPALACRVSGYEVLLYSRFWILEQQQEQEQEIVEKLTQAWFRYLSERFSALHIRGEKDQSLKHALANLGKSWKKEISMFPIVNNTLSFILVSEMSKEPRIARQLIETISDRIYEGALESQSKYYAFAMSDNWLLLDVYRKQTSLHVTSPDEPVGQVSRRQIGSRFKPRQPRYLGHLSDAEIDR